MADRSNHNDDHGCEQRERWGSGRAKAVPRAQHKHHKHLGQQTLHEPTRLEHSMFGAGVGAENPPQHRERREVEDRAE
jgi:hypothetical protein